MPQSNVPPPRIGWPLLPVPGADGRLSYPSLDESVRQSLEILLRTRPGEQLLRSDFGAGLENLLHEPNTLTTRRRIRDLVTDSLNLWETRILLDRVEVWEVPDRPAEVRVEIAYRLRRTGAARQTALTLELGT
jgi:phage baseplate assembly protein W